MTKLKSKFELKFIIVGTIIFLSLFILSACSLRKSDLNSKQKNALINNKQTKHGTKRLALDKNNLMQLTSSNFNHNSFIPNKFTCDGQDISPQLQITGVPPEAKSLALIADDPDAPAGDWVHWLVWNIDPKTSIIESGEIPNGAVQGLNDFGRNNYGGPCPPSGIHHYNFKLYALDKELDLVESSKKKELESAMQGHILEQAELIGLYQRK